MKHGVGHEASLPRDGLVQSLKGSVVRLRCGAVPELALAGADANHNLGEELMEL